MQERTAAGAIEVEMTIEGGVAVGSIDRISAVDRVIVDSGGIGRKAHPSAAGRRDPENVAAYHVLDPDRMPAMSLTLNLEEGDIVSRILAARPGRVDVGVGRRPDTVRCLPAVIAGHELNPGAAAHDAMRRGDDEVSIGTFDHAGRAGMGLLQTGHEQRTDRPDRTDMMSGGDAGRRAAAAAGIATSAVVAKAMASTPNGGLRRRFGMVSMLLPGQLDGKTATTRGHRPVESIPNKHVRFGR